jgi:hypothetical protein
VIFAYDRTGPLLPEGTPELVPGAFNRWYPVKQAEAAVHNAHVALDAAQRTLRYEREKAENE